MRVWTTVLVLLMSMGGCGGFADEDTRTVVFRHAKLFGDPRAFDALMATFEQETGIRVRRETLPASSDEQHLFYAINLQARSDEFDVLALDVIWTAEFARAGWLRDLSHRVSDFDRHDFFDGALRSATWEGHSYALPWFIDGGVLYYRKDLLAKHGLVPPRTWDELVRAARTVASLEPNTYGFVWQGKQYEGLVCNAMEYIWSFGGDVSARASDADGALRALAFMRGLVVEGITPDFVSTLTEEPARVIFGKGRAVFLRNWPYAWKLFEKEGSPVRGRVGVAPLPSVPGHPSAATLGGWQLGVNAFSKRPREAEQLVAFLARPAAHKALALAYGFSPPRRSLYDDAELVAAQPFLASLHDVFETARPRPVTPFYIGLSQVLQAQFSAVITGVRTPREALASISHALGTAPMR